MKYAGYATWICTVGLLAFAAFVCCCEFSHAADWAQWGGSPGRNNAPEGQSLPAEWDVGKFDRKTRDWISDEAENVLFASKLGDLGPYGKQVVLFYTQTKTVTARWFDASTTSQGVNTTISLR